MAPRRARSVLTVSNSLPSHAFGRVGWVLFVFSSFILLIDTTGGGRQRCQIGDPFVERRMRVLVTAFAVGTLQPQAVLESGWIGGNVAPRPPTPARRAIAGDRLFVGHRFGCHGSLHFLCFP